MSAREIRGRVAFVPGYCFAHPGYEVLRHRPRKRRIQYSEASVTEAKVRGILDTPLPLKLSLNRGLVDDGPHFLDSLVQKFIEYVFGKRDFSAVYRQTEQQSFRRAVKTQPACDPGRLGNQQTDVKIQIRNRTKIFFQHRAIAG